MFESAKFIEYQSSSIPSSLKDSPSKCHGWNMEFPIDRNWKTATNKVLFIVGHLTTEEIKSKKLFKDSTTLSGVVKLARSYASKFGIVKGSWSYAAVNFTHFKSYHLSGSEYELANSAFVKRIKSLVTKLKPTHVVVLGDSVALTLFPNIENLLQKRGWVHKVDGISVVTTLDINSSGNQIKVDEDDDNDEDDEELNRANSLGYIARNIGSIYKGSLLYQAKIPTINPVLIDTIKKFDKFYAVLDSAQVIAVDSETANLNVINNRILTIQFAFNPRTSYIVPIEHSDTPFKSKDIDYIKGKLRAFFMKKVDPITHFLIGQNLKFDFRIFRHLLGIPYIYWNCFDLMGGQHSLDENLKILKKLGTPAYGLAQIATTYGNDWYLTAKFSKQDRMDLDKYPLSNKDALNYCAADCQIPFSTYYAMLEQASHLPHGKGFYSSIYKKFVVGQVSNLIHAFSYMEANGALLDLKWVFHLKDKSSPLRKQIAEIKEKLYKRKAVKEANRQLLADSGIPTKGLFGTITKTLLDLNKPAHKKLLFFDIMGLQPINKSEKTGEPSVDKVFQKVYANVPEVKMFEDISKLNKLISTYVVGFSKKLNNNLDSVIDKCLRPGYGFWDVVTGRSNSFKPSLQQVPTRSVESKYIKRMFITPQGSLLLKMDFSAHEVRVWSIISYDEVLAEVFRLGRNLRRKLYRAIGERADKLRKLLELKGDIHKLNANFFFGTPVLKVTKDERADVKGVAFGVIYGKAAATLARELNKSKKFMLELFEKFFKRYRKASNWLENIVVQAATHLYADSPIGRRRNLFGFLIDNQRIQAALGRRAKNSPIQGMGADIGHTAARLFLQNMWELMLKLEKATLETREVPYKLRTMVHDSVVSSVSFDLLLLAYHVLHHSTTHGVTNYYLKHFGIKFTIPPEIEVEFGADESRMYKTDFSASSLKDCITKSLADYQEIWGKIDVDLTLDLIYKDYSDDNIRSYLEKKYPVLQEG